MKIKLCPYCNGEPDLVGTSCYWVRCSECEAETADADTKAEAVAIWNARADDWVPVSEGLPEVRCLAFTPVEDRGLRYRIIPAGMFKQVATEATHWRALPQDPIFTEGVHNGTD